MPIDLIFSPDRVNNTFEMARRRLVKALVDMEVPAPYGSWPEPEDHEAVKHHIRYASDVFDTWLRTIGEEVERNAYRSIDMRCFTGKYAEAVDGWATYELDREVECLREDQGELVA